MRREAETEALKAALRGSVLSTSIVGAAELLLAARRGEGADGVAAAESVISSLNLIALSLALARDASRLTSLRSLDALHLASALSIRSELAAIVVYDRRLANEASLQGLAVSSPR